MTEMLAVKSKTKNIKKLLDHFQHRKPYYTVVTEVAQKMFHTFVYLVWKALTCYGRVALFSSFNKSLSNKVSLVLLIEHDIKKMTENILKSNCKYLSIKHMVGKKQINLVYLRPWHIFYLYQVGIKYLFCVGTREENLMTMSLA